ncbi:MULTISPECIES: ABC-2 transporter permease [unclassified Clostridium]|nr:MULTISPECIES: ABC-2 transporter permease [unclassified Clostridium]MCR1949583.1 ABC-2 transporter permease [Clostridium sp. DSM 100503]
MNRILNLLFLQFQTVLSLKKYMALVIAMGIFLGFISPQMITFSGALYIMATCYSTAFYEEKSKMNYLIYSLPIKPKEYILSRYIFVAINTLIAIIISSVLYTGLTSFNIVTISEIGPLWSLIYIMIGIGIFMMSILIPFELILGFEKGRIALVFLAVFPMVFSTELIKYLPKINFDMLIVKILVGLCVFTLVLASYFITSNVYSKKDI